MQNKYSKILKMVLCAFCIVFMQNLFSQENVGGGCVDPVITATSGPGDTCEGQSVVLTATHNGDDVNWYDSEVGGNLLGSGSPFEYGPLSSTTSFWAEAYTDGTGATITGGARVAPTNTTNSSVVPATSPWGLAFNADVDFTINAVDVYIADTAPGSVVIQLKDSGLTVLEEVTVATPVGNGTNPVQFTITLDFFVPAGLDYNLVAESSPDMVREFSSGHPGFPYPLGTAGTVTNGTINDNDTNPNVYYFFYNWTVTPGQICYSDRVEETVIVNPIPAAPVADANQNFNAGETLADLDVTGTNLTWYSDPAATMVIPDTTPLEDGETYYVTQTVADCESEVISITVTEILGVVSPIFEKFALFPNPASKFISIENEFIIDKVEVFSILGQRVQTMDIDSKSYALDVSKLTQGNYLLKVYSEGNSITRKFVKQ